MEDKFQLLKKRDFGEVINDTFAFIRLNLKPFGQVILILIMPLMIIGSFFYTQYFASMLGTLESTRLQDVARAFAHKNLAYYVGYFGSLISSTLLHLAIYQTAIKYESSERGGLESADIFRGVRNSFWPYVGFIFGFGLIIFLAAIPAIIVIVIITLTRSPVLIALAALCMIVAVFYFVIAISMAPFIYLREGRGIFNALRKSFYLIKGFWWQTFALLIVMGLISLLASGLFALPFSILFFIKMYHSVTDGLSPQMEIGALGKISAVFVLCGISLIGSITQFSLILQYYSLVERKEGEGINKSIDEIGSPEAPAPIV